MQEFDYKNKIIELSDNYLLSINNVALEDEKLFANSLVEFAQNKDNNLASLAKLKEKILASEEALNNHTLEVKNKIDAILNNIEQELKEFDIKKGYSAEEKKIINNRELVFRLKKGQIDKIINEASANIESLEKECFDKINSLEKEIKELDKNYNQKIIDEEKKTKIEVKKLNDSILAPIVKDEELTKIDPIEATEDQLLKIDKALDNKTNELRINGINQIYQIKTNYYQNKKQDEVAYITKRLDLKKQIELTKNSTDEKVANLRHIVNEEDNRLRNEDYITTHNAMLNLAAIRYKTTLLEIKHKEERYLEIKKIYQENDIKDNTKLNNRNEILVLVSNLEKEMIDNYYQSLDKMQTTCINKLARTKELLIGIIKQILNLSYELLDDYLRQRNEFEKECINLLVTKYYKEEYLGGYEYSLHNNNLDVIIESFQNESKSQYNAFANEVNRLATNLENSIIENFKAFDNYLLNESHRQNLHKQSLINEIDACLESGKVVSTDIDKMDLDCLKDNISLHNNWYLEITNNFNQEKADAKVKYQRDSEELKNKKDEFLANQAQSFVNEVNNFKSNMKVIKAQPKHIKQKYDKYLSDELNRINEEYKKKIELVNLEKEEKSQMCKKN